MPPKKKNLVHLPQDVLGNISAFVDPLNLWITCKSLWDGELRKDIVYLFLEDQNALRFYEEEDFRVYVYLRVRNPNKQISLDLSYCDQVADVSALGQVHTLNLSYCRTIADVSALDQVVELTLPY